VEPRRSGQARRGAGDLNAEHPLYLLMAYAKARQENLTPEEKRTMRELAALLKGKRK
jgi:hypothetical protein